MRGPLRPSEGAGGWTDDGTGPAGRARGPPGEGRARDEARPIVATAVATLEELDARGT